MGKTALIIVDYQNDFLPGGALGVEGGHQAYPRLLKLAKEADVIIFTRDWHPADHVSFASGTPEFRDGSWPPHCVQDTEGAEIDEMLWDDVQALGKPVYLVTKGDVPTQEQYSGFQGWVSNDASGRYGTGGGSLVSLLADANVTSVVIGGLALDYCVLNTAIDAATHLPQSVNVTVDIEATRPVAYETGARAVARLASSGVNVQ